jgi:UDP-N-acetylmuramoyl-tripeptide--D-alanyl-D-alanine ligase
MRLSTAEIASATGSALEVSERMVEGYSIDSRTLHAGDLFFALRGKHYDGHGFVKQAFEKGAAAAVVEGSYRTEAGAPLIRVRDTERALQQLARAVRRKWGGRVIGITGSMGKTTTKEMVAAVLAQKFRVHKSEGNLNNHYGVPLTLLNLEPQHQVAVLEMAMSGPKEIELLASIGEPETGVVTNVAPVHLQFFDSLDSIARAKRELVEGLRQPAAAVLNHDDERVRQFSEGFKGRVVTFGLEEGADVRAINVRSVGNSDGSPVGMEFEIRGGASWGSFHLPLPGRHNVENAMAAVATASLFDVDPDAVRAALRRFQPLSQRAQVARLAGNRVLIDDAYNSNPRAAERMIEVLSGWPGAAHRIFLAGAMLELGSASPDLHRRVGRLAAESGVDWVLAVEGDARHFVSGAVEAGMPEERALFFLEAEEAGHFCAKIAEPRDVILVKGSRSVHLERAVAILNSEL